MEQVGRKTNTCPKMVKDVVRKTIKCKIGKTEDYSRSFNTLWNDKQGKSVLLTIVAQNLTELEEVSDDS